MKPEITVRGIILAIILTILLSASNAYLALKLGLLTSASIPAAILSMGILRFFKRSSILENNAVQTAASAGEAVAGGIVYTIPAMIIIHYWYHFDYWTNFFIAAIGGTLGVLFSIPLRRILVHDPSLKFPEGVAIANILKSSVHQASQFRYLLMGGGVGALVEFGQSGLKCLASQWSHWWVIHRTLFGVSMGFSATMFGAGFLIGKEMALSLLLGVIFAWFLALPIDSFFHPDLLAHHTASDAAAFLWSEEIRYMGIGAMLCAGVWTFIQFFQPLVQQIKHSVRFKVLKNESALESDLPGEILLLGVLFCTVLLLWFFYHFVGTVGLLDQQGSWIVMVCVFYILCVGFLFSIITAYFSGMVGVSASPGSSIVIAGLLCAAWILLSMMHYYIPGEVSQKMVLFFEALTILVGSIVTGIAAIANDNSQDLKVGQLVGATPWKQQLMLLLGVLVASLVIPWVMEILFNRYGIAGVVPHVGMNPNDTLPSPVAAVLAAMTLAVFQHELPWAMLGTGAAILMGCIFINHIFRLERYVRLSMLGIAVGMYLPLTTSMPLMIGGLVSYLVFHRKTSEHAKQTGVMIACGLVSGAALMDVVISAMTAVV